MKLQLILCSLSVLLAFLATAESKHRGPATVYNLEAVPSGNCNFQRYPSSTKKYYGALNAADFDDLKTCGEYISVSCVGCSKSVLVQIVDKCPSCAPGGIDISPDAFREATGQEWTVVDVEWDFQTPSREKLSENIEYCIKDGSNGHWTAFQPAKFAKRVASLDVNGKKAQFNRMDAYYFLVENTNALDFNKPIELTLRSTDNEVVQSTVVFGGQKCKSTNEQFSTGGSPPSPPITPSPPTPTSPPTTPSPPAPISPPTTPSPPAPISPPTTPSPPTPTSPPTNPTPSVTPQSTTAATIQPTPTATQDLTPATPAATYSKPLPSQGYNSGTDSPVQEDEPEETGNSTEKEPSADVTSNSENIEKIEDEEKDANVEEGSSSSSLSASVTVVISTVLSILAVVV